MAVLMEVGGGVLGSPITKKVFVLRWGVSKTSYTRWHCWYRYVSAHQGRVTSVKFSLGCEWVLSCGKDKYFMWHCSETGRRLGGYQAGAWCLCLEYPSHWEHPEAEQLQLVLQYQKLQPSWGFKELWNVAHNCNVIDWTVCLVMVDCTIICDSNSLQLTVVIQGNCWFGWSD